MLIPITLLQRYHDITLPGYVMYVNGINFINTIYRHIKFMTADNISNTEDSTLQNHIKTGEVHLHAVGVLCG